MEMKCKDRMGERDVNTGMSGDEERSGKVEIL